jgi:hypothetical protein
MWRMLGSAAQLQRDRAGSTENMCRVVVPLLVTFSIFPGFQSEVLESVTLIMLYNVDNSAVIVKQIFEGRCRLYLHNLISAAQCHIEYRTVSAGLGNCQ